MNKINYIDTMILTMLINSNEKVDLINIISYYDYVNHAIVTAKEINHALCVLKKYIALDENKKLYTLYECLKLKTKMFDKYSFAKQADIIYKKLLKEVKLDNAKIKKYFSSKDIDKAYTEYTKSINIKKSENIF